MKVTDIQLFMTCVVICTVFDPKDQVPEQCLSTRMRNKKFKVQTCACEVMTNVFWESEFLKRGATINSERCAQILKKLQQRIRRIWPYSKMNQSPFPPNSPDLGHFDFHLFGPLEGGTPRTSFRRRRDETARTTCSDASANSFTRPQ
jgi:hypothetical protein